MTRRQVLKAAVTALGTRLVQGILATVGAGTIVTAQTVIEIRRGPQMWYQPELNQELPTTRSTKQFYKRFWQMTPH